MRKILTLFIILLFYQSGGAEERLGVLELEELLIKPEFYLQEPQQGEFKIDQVYLSTVWKKDQHIGAKFLIGPRSLMHQNSRFNSSVGSELGLVEAYAQMSGEYGRLRLGLLPIEYGVEGALSESKIIFHRSLLFQKKIVSLRDIGLSYAVGDNGYYTQLTVHNGESDANTDGRMFLTSSWGYTDYDIFNFGVSGQTGTTKPISTSASGDTLAGVDVNSEALWRIGDLYFDWHPHKWNFSVELNVGELEQGTRVTKFESGHIDLGYKFSNQWALYSRYDLLDPNKSVGNDLEKQLSLAIALSDRNGTSNVYLILTKIIEENVDINNDQLRLVWQLTPLTKIKGSR